MKKKIIVFLVSVMLLTGVFVLSRNFLFSPEKALANPDACKVTDSLEVTGNLDIGSAGCELLEKNGSYANVLQAELASPSCSPGKVLVSGGCYCQEDGNVDEAAIKASSPATDGSAWLCTCMRTSGTGRIEVRSAYAWCCF